MSRTFWLLIATLVLAAMFLLPILKSPLLGDDAFNSYMSGFMLYHNEPWWQFWWDYDTRLISGVGRWIPGTTLIFLAMWCSTQQALPVKICQIIAIVVNLWLFYGFVRRIGSSHRLAVLAAALTIPTFQVRLFYDPVAGIMLTMQVVLGLILFAASFYWDYLEDQPRRWRLYLSVAAYAAAGLTYETTYLYVFVFAMVAFLQLRNIREALVSILPFLAVVAILVLKDLYTRHIGSVQFHPGVPVAQNEYVLTFNPATILHTWWLQTFGAVPLEYYWFDPMHYFPPLKTLILRSSRIAPIVGLIAFGVIFVLMRSITKFASSSTEKVRIYSIFGIGILLAIVPGFLIALSPRWQVEVVPGQAYLPVYDAGFGVALIAATAVWLLIRNRNIDPVLVAMGSVAYAFVVFTVFQANALTLSMYDPVWNWGRQNLTQALSDGLIRSVPADSSIFVDKSYPFFFDNAYIWDTRYLVYMYTHQRVDIRNPDLETPNNPVCGVHPSQDCRPITPTYELHNVPTSYDAGFVSLAKIFSIRKLQDAHVVTTADSAVIVERGSPMSIKRPAHVALDLADRDFQRIDYGPDFNTFSVTSSCGPIDTHAFTAATASGLKYGPGFFGAESSATASWQWSESNSVLTVSNETATKQTIDVNLVLKILAPGTWKIRVADGRTIETLLIGQTPINFHRRYVIPAFGAVDLHFHTNAPKPSALMDPRNLHFGVFNARTTTAVHC